MKAFRFILLCLLIESLIILSIALANALGTPWFYLFYTIGYGLLLSVLLPVWISSKSGFLFSNLGIKAIRARDAFTVIVFIVFSVGGQLIPLHVNSVPVRYDLLPVCIFPLILTTLFEELLFRGFMQTRFQQLFGTIPAIILSGLAFSVYHIGYPGFRTVYDILLLWAVGTGFALSFRLTANNVIASFLVNLPNAFVTYILRQNQFPVDAFTVHYIVISIVVLLLLSAGIWLLFQKTKNNASASF